jgi:excisionase family DNA binding protein
MDTIDKPYYSDDETTATTRRQWATMDETARYFSCSRRTVEQLVKDRVVPVMRVGRVVRVDLLGAERVFMGK